MSIKRVRKINPMELGLYLIELGLSLQKRDITVQKVKELTNLPDIIKLIDNKNDWESDIEPIDRLSALLEIQSISQSELARRTGVSKQFVSDIINKRKNLSLKTASKFAKALGVKRYAIL